ncbi:MAG: UDP-N-acetylmuramate dehydrogenase, partial [Endozoicomonas sp.]
MPITIHQNYALTHQNTLGLPSVARYYTEVSSVAELQEVLGFAKEKTLAIIPLGGGSNVVFGDCINDLVIHIALMGREVVDRNGDRITVTAGAGENWHEFVLWSIEQNAFGFENLSLIPGTVGAAPIQNIGAYGVEIKDHFVALEALNIVTGQLEQFDVDDCQFGYRDSVFKGRLRDQYIITSVTFALDAVLSAKLGYGQLSEKVGSKGSDAQKISQAVCEIRQQKLPDPKVIGNVGSFFKNPEVDHKTMERLKKEYPDIVAYPVDGKWKLAAGWLIDRAGLRGVKQGHVGTYEKQALVLVNHGEATGAEVIAFSELVLETVKSRNGLVFKKLWCLSI